MQVACNLVQRLGGEGRGGGCHALGGAGLGDGGGMYDVLLWIVTCQGEAFSY